MDLKNSVNPMEQSHSITVRFSELECVDAQRYIVEVAIRKVASAIAEWFIAEHGQDILKSIDPRAVATPAVADSAAAVRKSLEKTIFLG